MQIQEILTAAFHAISIGYSLVLAYKFAMGLHALRPVPIPATTRAPKAYPTIQNTMAQGRGYAIALPSTAASTAKSVSVIETSPSNQSAEVEIAPILTPEPHQLTDPWNEPEPTARKSPRWIWIGSLNSFDSISVPSITAPSEGKSTTLRLASSTTVNKPTNKIELQSLPSRQLKKMASNAKIPGYSKMKKAELITALSA